ncbi:hypothetical protein BDV98DRAFT_376400 [Pterulicium gracile]|uniref:Uncharacterized protein n=1 Tax=Pterulicium gracile TaxID=1884261 RepID=A0A5C3Q0R4_9AGAR|nr:hypothetical protein BDV98DRAFT_376400 [Pterula gracilis]
MYTKTMIPAGSLLHQSWLTSSSSPACELSGSPAAVVLVAMFDVVTKLHCNNGCKTWTVVCKAARVII